MSVRQGQADTPQFERFVGVKATVYTLKPKFRDRLMGAAS
jgi:hypothetical protein